MAILEPNRKREWKAALAESGAAWIVCGLPPATGSAAAAVAGITGLIDWNLHGQISRLLQRGQLSATQPALFPGDPSRRRPSIMLFPVGAGASALAKQITRLKVKELAMAESTFPEDFRAKLKQTLTKEGILCTKLEP